MNQMHQEYAIYEVLDADVEDDRGIKSKLQYQSGGYTSLEEASREASRLTKMYQNYYSFKVLPVR